MKYGTFRKVNFTIELTHMYGHYMIRAMYRGKEIKVMTTDSEAYDFLNDDSDKEKHQDARRHCYNKITDEYDRLYR